MKLDLDIFNRILENNVTSVNIIILQVRCPGTAIFRILIPKLYNIMYIVLYNFVQPKRNFVHISKPEISRFFHVRAAATLPQHAQKQILLRFKCQPYSIMYFFLYNFVQPKRNPDIKRIEAC